ncbi:hypothetical protein [Barnesiella viscericola]|uniref:hypothetical protein n=1 Tax=Barnesiella viscericola TaxID=397865 RepID=UPI00255BC95F|nr:hypothetical protein [Barnesiella viscericola]
MKKSIILVFVMMSCFLGISAQQSVIIQQNGKSENVVKNSGEFFINGISSKVDIGGVEAEVSSTRQSRYQGEEVHLCFVRIKNYNAFTVTVLYQAGKDKTIGSVVLQSGETKSKDIGYVTTGLGGAIPPAMYSVSTITRKL